MALLTKAPKGTQDILNCFDWQVIEDVLRSEAASYGFSEIRTPVFEHTELFLRSVGETTDVVQKEMYTFDDKGDRSITLRPEGTAGVVRAFLEHGIFNQGLPVKKYYLTSCYRYENTQKGRLREFHQFGAEVFGAPDPLADAELIAMAHDIFERLGLENLSLELNSIGCPNCRPKYHEALKAYLSAHRDALCGTCQERMERNPMRVLDCKNPTCGAINADAPVITDSLCDDCRCHFDRVRHALDSIGIAYTVNPRIVRGLDYYTRTVFEFVSSDLGAQSTVCGGGRYDGLVEEIGGSPTPALGFAIGLERLMMILEAQGVALPPEPTCEVYVAALGEAAQEKAFQLVHEMRQASISAQGDICGRSLKAQMKYADKIGAQFTLVLGEDELSSQKAQLKHMKTGEKFDVRLDGSFLHDYILAQASGCLEPAVPGEPV
jgi:histidyl-tRNA synthetase